MKFTKHQKETIKGIYRGDIYDIASYLKYFNLGCYVKFNKEEILNKFNSDKIPKKYYCANLLKRKYVNIISEYDYNKKVQNGDINPENYSAYDLHLNFNSGIKHEFWKDTEYFLDFYNGVYIANRFDDILEFLTLWQFLISEMLILEVPHNFSADTLGLFYIKSLDLGIEKLSLKERIKNINFDDFSYDDKYYLQNNYILSQEHCLMCKEYMDKRIYPSTKLGVFITKHFSTFEETTQNKALFVAWLAIFVSIALTFAPYFQPKDNSDIESITAYIKDIKSSIEKKELSEDLSSKLDIIIEKLDILSEETSSKNKTEEAKETNNSSKQ